MMNGLTGLEYLTSVMQQTIPHAPMHELMHMKIAAVEYGKISYEFVPLNRPGIVGDLKL